MLLRPAARPRRLMVRAPPRRFTAVRGIFLKVFSGQIVTLIGANGAGKSTTLQENGMHAKYNVPALKMYMLEQYIRSAGDGREGVAAFARALWDAAKDYTEPRQLSEQQIISALAKVVGDQKSGYLRQLAAGTQFKVDDFRPLVPAFNAYVDWQAGRFFGGNRTRFLLFLDIVAAKGAEWPHYATYPHQLEFRATDGMRDFDAALSRAGKSAPDKADVLAALKAATGKDHSGFYEFWEGFGITVQPGQPGPSSQHDLAARESSLNVPGVIAIAAFIVWAAVAYLREDRGRGKR